MDTRKAAYFLIAMAILGNSMLAFWYSGIKNEIDDIKENIIGSDTDERYVEVMPLKEGDWYSSEYNLTMEVESDDGSGEPDRGRYDLAGSVKRVFDRGSLVTSLRGRYDITQNSSSKSPIISGSVDRCQNTSYGKNGELRDQSVRTEVTTDGGSLKSVPGSEINTYGKEISGVWDEILWISIVRQCCQFNSNSSGSVTLDLDLEGGGQSVDSGEFKWRVENIDNQNFQEVVIAGELVDVNSIDMDFKLTFQNGSRYPSSYKYELANEYYCEGRDLSLSMSVSEVKKESSSDQGENIPSFFRKSDAGTSLGDGIDLVPRDGNGPTRFPSTPDSCMNFALSESTGLQGFLEEYGRESVSVSKMRFQLNDTMIPGPTYLWNITLTAECEYLLHPQYTVVVGTEVREGVVKRNSMRLIREFESLTTICPGSSRSIIDMATEERALKGDPNCDVFFLGDIYSPNYRMDMVSRDGSGPPLIESLLMRAFGMKRMISGDYFISQVKDSSDMTLHAVAVNGINGELDYRITASGPCVPLISSYGIDPA